MTKDIAADKCPGCGFPISRIEGKGTDWETVIYTCGTGEESGYYGRKCWANQCAVKEEQLSQNAALFREVAEVVQEIANGACSDCELQNGLCIHQRSQALLPRLETEIKGKP